MNRRRRDYTRTAIEAAFVLAISTAAGYAAYQLTGLWVIAAPAFVVVALVSLGFLED